MKVSYVEGLASHGGPESCVYIGNGVREALTGVRAGQVLSREIHAPHRKVRVVRGAEAVEISRRRNRGARVGESAADPARSETLGTCACNLFGNREIPCFTARRWEAWVAVRIVKPTGVRR
jgi:hypothetical protein